MVVSINKRLSEQSHQPNDDSVPVIKKAKAQFEPNEDDLEEEIEETNEPVLENVTGMANTISKLLSRELGQDEKVILHLKLIIFKKSKYRNLSYRN